MFGLFQYLWTAKMILYSGRMYFYFVQTAPLMGRSLTIVSVGYVNLWSVRTNLLLSLSLPFSFTTCTGWDLYLIL